MQTTALASEVRLEIVFGGALVSSLAEVMAEVIRELRGPITNEDVAPRRAFVALAGVFLRLDVAFGGVDFVRQPADCSRCPLRESRPRQVVREGRQLRHRSEERRVGKV